MANTDGTRAISGSASSTSPEAHGVVRVRPEEAVRALGGGGGGGGQVVDPGAYFVDQGGPVLTHVRLVPIFWGKSWALNPNPTSDQVTHAISQMVSGIYLEGLAQYRDIGHGEVVITLGSQATSTDPPNPFTINDVSNLVTNLIQAGTLPSPQASDQFLYIVFMPPGVAGPPGIAGEHWWFPFGSGRAHYGWVLGGTLDSITWVFSHELAEACSDPEGTGMTFSPPACGDPGSWCEIGDVCEWQTVRLNGVNVQAYWSQRDRACIVPSLTLWRSLGVQVNGGLSAIQNADGRLEVLARGVDGSLGHLAETWPGGSWTLWNSLGGAITGRVVTAANGDGRLEALVRGTEGALWHLAQTAPSSSAWGAWESLGGGIDDLFAVGVNPDGRLEAFARGTDGALWHLWQTLPGGRWSAWESLGGQIQTALCVARNADGRLEVFVEGTDGAVWTIWQTVNGGWSNWASLGGGVAALLAVGPNADGRLELFAQGTDSTLWHVWQVAPNGTWSAWESLGGSVQDALAVATNLDGRLEVFVRAADFQLWHIWQTAPNNGWSNWAPFAGQAGNALAAVNHPDGRIEVFSHFSTGSVMWHIWQIAPNNGWNP